MVIFDKKSKGNGYYNKIFSTSLQIALLSTSAAVIAEGADFRDPLTPISPGVQGAICSTPKTPPRKLSTNGLENNYPNMLPQGDAYSNLSIIIPKAPSINNVIKVEYTKQPSPDQTSNRSLDFEAMGSLNTGSENFSDKSSSFLNMGPLETTSLDTSSDSTFKPMEPLKNPSPGTSSYINFEPMELLKTSPKTPPKTPTHAGIPQAITPGGASSVASSITLGSGLRREDGTPCSPATRYISDEQKMLSDLKALESIYRKLDELTNKYHALLTFQGNSNELTEEQKAQESEIKLMVQELNQEKDFLKRELENYQVKKSFDMNPEWNSPNSIPGTPTTNGTPSPTPSEEQKQDTMPKLSIQEYIKLSQITHKKGTPPLYNPFTSPSPTDESPWSDKPSPPQMNPLVNKRLFINKSSSATKIQSIVRMHQAKANYQKQQKATTLIENTFRGYKAKKELGILKTNAAIEERKKKEIAFNIAKEAATKKALTKKDAKETISKALLNWAKLRRHAHHVGSAAVTVKQWQSYVSNKKNAAITKGVMHFLHSSDIAIDKRMSTAIAAGDEKSMEKRFWIKGVVGKADQTGDNAFSSINNAVVIGCDAEVIEDSITLGVAYSTGANKSKIKEDSTKIKTHIDMFSLYGRYNLTNNFFFKGTTSYGTLKIYGTGDDTNKGSTYRASGKVGYNFAHKNNVIITPEIGLSYNKVTVNSYKETIPGVGGRPANNAIHPKYSTDVFACDISASASTTKQIASGTITPNIHAGINTVLKEKYKNDKAYYVRTKNPIDIANEQNTKTTYNLGCGVDISRNGAVNLSVGYDANFRKNYKAHNGFIKLELKF